MKRLLIFYLGFLSTGIGGYGHLSAADNVQESVASAELDHMKIQQPDSMHSTAYDDAKTASVYQAYKAHIENLAHAPLEKHVDNYIFLVKAQKIDNLTPLQSFELCVLAIHSFNHSLKEFTSRPEYQKDAPLYDKVSAMQTALYEARDRYFSQLSFFNKAKIFIREHSTTLITVGLSVPVVILVGFLFRHFKREHSRKKNENKRKIRALKDDKDFKRSVAESFAKDAITVPQVLKDKQCYASLSDPKKGLLEQLVASSSSGPIVETFIREEVERLESQLRNEFRQSSSNADVNTINAIMDKIKKYIVALNTGRDGKIELHNIEQDKAFGVLASNLIKKYVDPLFSDTEVQEGHSKKYKNKASAYHGNSASFQRNGGAVASGRKNSEEFVEKPEGDQNTLAESGSGHENTGSENDDQSKEGDDRQEDVNGRDNNNDEGVAVGDQALKDIIAKGAQDLEKLTQENKEILINYCKNFEPVRNCAIAFKSCKEFSDHVAGMTLFGNDTLEKGEKRRKAIKEALSSCLIAQPHEGVSADHMRYVAHEIEENYPDIVSSYHSDNDLIFGSHMKRVMSDFEQLYTFATAYYVTEYKYIKDLTGLFTSSSSYQNDKNTLAAILKEDFYKGEGKKFLEIIGTALKRAISASGDSIDYDRKTTIEQWFRDAGLQDWKFDT